MKLIDDIRAENLASLVQECGSLKVLAERLGKSESQVSQWINRSINSGTGKPRTMRSTTARAVEVACGKPEGWLDVERDVSHAPAQKSADLSLSEDADPAARHAESMRSYGLHPIAVWEHPDELPDGDFIQVPRLNVHLSAGNGHGEQLEVDLERANPQVFRAEWARRERLKPGALASMYAKGNSMEPRICDGDSLLVDTSQLDVLDGRVFAVWYSGELRVKRLYKRVDGGLIVHSDNERDYPKLDVPPEQLEHIRIIGRVVHVQGTGGL